MKTNKYLILAFGVLLSSQAATAATLQFSGYVSSIDKVGGMNSNQVQTGMLVSGTFEYDSSATASYHYADIYQDTSSYSTGVVTLTIGNGLWFSTVPTANSYALIQQTSVLNSYSSIYGDEVAFGSQGWGAFDTNLSTPTGGNRIDPDTALSLRFKNSDRTALGNSNLPLAALLTGNAFDTKTLSIKYDASVGVPCSWDYNQMCTDAASYTINATITSVSEVPLPPSLFLTGSSLSLLLLGKAARSKKQRDA